MLLTHDYKDLCQVRLLVFFFSGKILKGITDMLFVCTLGIVLPTMGIFQLENKIQNVSLPSAKMINDIILALRKFKVNLNSLARIFKGDRNLDFFLIVQGRIFPSVNTTHST